MTAVQSNNIRPDQLQDLNSQSEKSSKKRRISPSWQPESKFVKLNPELTKNGKRKGRPPKNPID